MVTSYDIEVRPYKVEARDVERFLLTVSLNDNLQHAGVGLSLQDLAYADIFCSDALNIYVLLGVGAYLYGEACRTAGACGELHRYLAVLACGAYRQLLKHLVVHRILCIISALCVILLEDVQLGGVIYIPCLELQHDAIGRRLRRKRDGAREAG